jgi:uncharacterized protein YgiM (DUF1202 family)
MTFLFSQKSSNIERNEIYGHHHVEAKLQDALTKFKTMYVTKNALNGVTITGLGV